MRREVGLRRFGFLCINYHINIWSVKKIIHLESVLAPACTRDDRLDKSRYLGYGYWDFELDGNDANEIFSLKIHAPVSDSHSGSLHLDPQECSIRPESALSE